MTSLDSKKKLIFAANNSELFKQMQVALSSDYDVIPAQNSNDLIEYASEDDCFAIILDEDFTKSAQIIVGNIKAMGNAQVILMANDKNLSVQDRSFFFANGVVEILSKPTHASILEGRLKLVAHKQNVKNGITPGQKTTKKDGFTLEALPIGMPKIENKKFLAAMWEHSKWPNIQMFGDKKTWQDLEYLDLKTKISSHLKMCLKSLEAVKILCVSVESESKLIPLISTNEKETLSEYMYPLELPGIVDAIKSTTAVLTSSFVFVPLKSGPVLTILCVHYSKTISSSQELMAAQLVSYSDFFKEPLRKLGFLNRIYSHTKAAA